MSETRPEAQRIEGRVAQIINARELIINIGSTQGVKLGMKFAVLAETPLEVHDPGTGELLDIIDREKVRVEASEVRPKVSICRTYRKKYTPGGPMHLGSIAVGLTTPPKEVPETLEAKSASLPPPLSPEESYVKINDRVVQVTDEK